MSREFLKKQPLIYPVLRYLNQTYLEAYYHISFFLRRTSGIESSRRDVPVIVSLTTIPERMHKVYLTVESLFLQSTKPDDTILWVSDRLTEKDIPRTLDRQRSRGLRIEFRRDIGPLTKIFYALREYGTSIIVTADDDHLYMKNWLKQLYDAYVENPEYIHCHRAYQMKKTGNGELAKYDDWELIERGARGPSLSLFPTGVGGVLYPPGSLHEEIRREDLLTELCPTADDIWLKAMSLLKGTPCKRVGDYTGRAVQMKGLEHKALKLDNIMDGKNDQQIDAVFSHFRLFEKLDG